MPAKAGTQSLRLARTGAPRPEDHQMALAPRFRGCQEIRRRPADLSFSSFPRKREPRDFSRLPLGPRFRGGDDRGQVSARAHAHPSFERSNGNTCSA